MQKKNGISLIVLVITIIVMIILAGVIMISLNNSGIIKRAEQAVEDTNLQEIRNLAALKWSEAYLAREGKATESYLYNAVKEGLIAQEIDISPYEIIVTTKGVTVNKIPTIADLEATHTFEYYSTLSGAVADVNNDTIGTNADVDKKDAVAGIYIEEEVPTVILLKDTTENAKIEPNKDVIINLGGHTVTFNNNLGISGMKDHDDTIIIDGRLSGSTIIINGTAQGARAIQTRTNTFIVNGGEYYASVDKDIISGSCEVDTFFSSNGGKLEMYNCKIIAYSNYVKDDNDKYSVLARGVYNDYEGTLILKNCEVRGVHSGVISGGDLYVDGGTYEGYGHGGFFFSGDGSETKNIYVKNIISRTCEMPTGYTDLGVGSKGVSAYIGGNSNSDNIAVYMDNCDLKDGIILRGTNGENDNTLYISNSIINEKIRIDNDTHRLYIGKGNTAKGNKFDISNVEIPSGVDLEKVVEETNEIYVK